MATIYSVMGPAGAPMKAAYGSFANKPISGGRSGMFSVMGPAGAPMKQRYGTFAGKTSAAFGLPHNLPLQATVGKLRSF